MNLVGPDLLVLAIILTVLVGPAVIALPIIYLVSWRRKKPPPLPTGPKEEN